MKITMKQLRKLAKDDKAAMDFLVEVDGQTMVGNAARAAQAKVHKGAVRLAKATG